MTVKSSAQGLRHTEEVLAVLRNRMAHLQVLIPSAQLLRYMR